MADLRRSIEIVFEGNDQASRKAADVLAQVKALDAQAAAASGSASKLSGDLENIGKKDTAILNAVNAMKAFAGALVVDRFVDTNVELEKFERGMRAVKGASTDTAEEFAFVSGVANRLGLSVLESADAYLKLSAAAKGTTIEGRDTRDIFEQVSRAMSSLGRSNSETERAFLALTQIISKGKVTMEELRGQLGEALPGAMGIAARAMGVTSEQMEDLVKKGIPAEDFIRKFGAELDRTFAGATFEGYTASMNRLRNTIDETFIAIGKAGAFDALITGVKVLTATFTGSISAIKLFGETAANIAFTFASGDFSGFGERFEASVDKATASTKSLLDALTGTDTEAKKAAVSAASIADGANQSAAETKRLTEQAKAAATATAELDLLFKRLGVDPKKTTAGFEEIAKALDDLAKNPKTNGEDFMLAVDAALKKAGSGANFDVLKNALRSAFDNGKISADQLADGLNKLDKEYQKVGSSASKTRGSIDDQAKALKAQAEASRKAEENAQKFRLEMEKLASNERIKLIEAKVTLDVARIEAQTKQVEAMFQSLDNTISSTGDLLGSLFGKIEGLDEMGFAARDLLESQIDLENARRGEALTLQKRLIEAQIEVMRRQADKLDKGLPLIQVDGSGLQPHLEAIMWELLKAIQIRVNEDGLEMLLGAVA